MPIIDRKNIQFDPETGAITMNIILDGQEEDQASVFVDGFPILLSQPELTPRLLERLDYIVDEVLNKEDFSPRDHLMLRVLHPDMVLPFESKHGMLTEEEVEPLRYRGLRAWASNFFPAGYLYVAAQVTVPQTGDQVNLGILLNVEEDEIDDELLAPLRPGYMQDGYYRITSLEQPFEVIDHFVDRYSKASDHERSIDEILGGGAYRVERVWVLDSQQADILRDLTTEALRKAEEANWEGMTEEEIDRMREIALNLESALAW